MSWIRKKLLMIMALFWIIAGVRVVSNWCVSPLGYREQVMRSGWLYDPLGSGIWWIVCGCVGMALFLKDRR